MNLCRYSQPLSSRFRSDILAGLLFLAATVAAGFGIQTEKAAVAAQGAARPEAIEFNRDVAPILQASCIKCHGAEKAQGELRLDSAAGLLRGGISGRIVIPGDSRGSLLVKRLLGAGGAPRMPLGGNPLPKERIQTICAWIDQGAGEEENGGNPQKANPAELGQAHAGPPARVPALQQAVEFAARIEPLFAAYCVQCHGPDTQQNGLRLDSWTSVLKGGANGQVIVPGHSSSSRLVRRLLGLDKPQMPYGAPPLSEAEIALIRHWIDAGAQGSDAALSPTVQVSPASAHKVHKHWAYIKPERPEVPEVKSAAWCRNPIDNFVLARLEQEGLVPSAEADKETLIRRLSLDLIGLPPTVEEVDAFLSDKSPNAYEKVVDRLLASPHYGERWARPWLDLARYADTNGYEKDDRRTAWEYRAWVINALNEDMSFREFTIDQIAGDMLPSPTTDQLIATGFHRNTMLNQEGGVDHEEYRWYSLVDRVNTTAEVWLGVTLGCAQCHNHKFDPFTNQDYYRFLAFFDNEEYKDLNLGQGEGWVEEPQVELPTPQQAAKSKELRAEAAKLQTVLDTSTPELDAAQAQWEREVKAAEASWSVLSPSRFSSTGGATLRLLADQSLLASGKNPETDTYILEAQTDRVGITGIRLEVMRDPSLPAGGPGRDSDGNFFLSEVEVEAAPVDHSTALQKVKFKDAVADESQGGYEVKNLVNDKPQPKGWAIDLLGADAPPVRHAILIPEKPLGFPGGTLLTIRLKHQMAHSARNLGRFRLAVTNLADSGISASVPARLRPVMDSPVAQRAEQPKSELAAVYRSRAPMLQPTRDRLKELNQQIGKLGIATALIMRERQSYERPYTFMHVRGSFTSLGDKVYAAVPASLSPLPADQMPNRLGLAHWLVSEDNPLTARVTVNRFWEALFGRGIVETSEDFGTQGTPPTHPELLDWLATEFMRQDWSPKKMLRLMVTSATYRQASRVTPELQERDPYNMLLARGPRFRVEAETVRDLALAASGLLSPKIGGPPVFPYQPEGIWDRPYNDDKWVISEGEDRYRRALYTFIRRTSPYPSWTTFDAPSREFCTVRRVRTNTPLQALTTLNDPAFFEAAQALGRRMMTDAGPNPAARATYGFRRCLARHPTAPELDRLVAFYNQQLERFRSDEKAAKELIKGYEIPAEDPLRWAEQAAWTMVANVLLNLDEMITKE